MASLSEVEVVVEAADDLLPLPPCFGTAAAAAAAAEVEEEQQRTKVTGRYDLEVGGGEAAKWKRCLRGRDDQTFKASIVI